MNHVASEPHLRFFNDTAPAELQPHVVRPLALFDAVHHPLGSAQSALPWLASENGQRLRIKKGLRSGLEGETVAHDTVKAPLLCLLMPGQQ